MRARRSIATLAIAALLALAALSARADDAYPFAIAAGAGPVWDDANDWGWSLRLAGFGHPGGLTWLQVGMAVEMFGRPEAILRDETEATTLGDTRVREWRTDAGSLIGAQVHFPFGFGSLESKPMSRDDLVRGGRREWEFAPTLAGGMYLDSSTTSSRRDTDGTRVKSVREGDEGTTHSAGAYGEIGARGRWRVLELALAAQTITDRPVQAAAWLGFNVPW
ncbi:MAG: hypothetical protein IT350_16820 [Deltaproteobacteria bacterium]|nr:hypothetical protein [Deltaproteobacteria bacterium]